MWSLILSLMLREGQIIEHFVLFVFLLFMKKQLWEERCWAAPACYTAQGCSWGRRDYTGCNEYEHCHSVQTSIMCQCGLAIEHSKQPWRHNSCCPASLSAPQTLQAKVGIKKSPQRLTFAPNICSGVSEDFEVSSLFVCFLFWDAVWPFLSPEIQNAALPSTICVSGSDWCLLEEHPGSQEMCVAECLSGYWLAMFIPSWFLLFHMSGRTFALPGH